jgi:predicted O-methyltransferase YrrM
MGVIQRWLGHRPRNTPAGGHATIRREVLDLARSAEGFLAEEEGLKLFDLAERSARRAPCLEIGSYCGKSTLFLAEGCRAARGHCVFSVDHHCGSVEQQPGEEYCNPKLYDSELGRLDTFPYFLRNLSQAGLLDWVIPVVGDSARVGRNWAGPLSLVFIDGGHSEEDVRSDYETWSRHVMSDGYLCFHDVFVDPEAGGQAPRRVFEKAQSSWLWQGEGVFSTLGVLRRR